jgi:hypothetical protein
VLGALACLAIAVLMIVNGKGLVSVMPYVIMVAYGCAAIWGLTTFRGKITIKQFAIEMVVLVAGTLALRTASPEMFSVEPVDGDAPAVRAIVKPHLPRNALGRYTQRSLTILRASDELAHPLPTTDAARVDMLLEYVEIEGLTELFNLLSRSDQERVDGIQKRSIKYVPNLVEAIEAHRRSVGRQSTFRAEHEGKHKTARELKAALIRAQGLRARILVVPDGASGSSVRTISD